MELHHYYHLSVGRMRKRKAVRLVDWSVRWKNWRKEKEERVERVGLRSRMILQGTSAAAAAAAVAPGRKRQLPFSLDVP